MKKNIEKIFRCSGSSNELFDTFQYAIKNKVGGVELYKILLANPTLNQDEIKMFAETLSKIFSEEASEIYSWTGTILESYASSHSEIEDSMNYFIKSWKDDRSNHEPLINLINMFNYDYDVSYNGIILNLATEGAEYVKKKSKVYYALADLFEKKKNIALKRKYMLLAEKSAREEN